MHKLLKRFAKKAVNPANQAAFADAFIETLMHMSGEPADGMISVLLEFPFIQERMSAVQWFDLLFLGGISFHNRSALYPEFRKAAIASMLAASDKEKVRLRARLIGAMERRKHINPDELEALFRTELGAVFWDEKFFTSLLLSTTGTSHSLVLAHYTHHPYRGIDWLAPCYERFLPKAKLKELIFSGLSGTAHMADVFFALWIALPFADEFAPELAKKIRAGKKLRPHGTEFLVAKMLVINPKTAELYLQYGDVSVDELFSRLTEFNHVRQAYQLATQGKLGSIKPDDLFFSHTGPEVLKEELKARIREDLRESKSSFLSRLLAQHAEADDPTSIERAILELVDESGGKTRAKLLGMSESVFLRQDLSLANPKDFARLILFIDELAKNGQRKAFTNFVDQQINAIAESSIASTVMNKLIEAAGKIGSDVNRGFILRAVLAYYESTRFALLRKALQEFGQDVTLLAYDDAILYDDIEFQQLATRLNPEEKKIVFDWFTAYYKKHGEDDVSEHIGEFISAEWSVEELEEGISRLVRITGKHEVNSPEVLEQSLHRLLLDLDPGKTNLLTPALARAYVELLDMGGSDHFSADELRLLRTKAEVPLIRDFLTWTKNRNGHIDGVDEFARLLRTKYVDCAKILRKKRSN